MPSIKTSKPTETPSPTLARKAQKEHVKAGRFKGLSAKNETPRSYIRNSFRNDLRNYFNEAKDALYRLIPFKGTINTLWVNSATTRRSLDTEQTAYDTSVVTINNKHAGILLHGHDASASPEETSCDFLYWGNKSDASQFFKTSDVGMSLVYTALTMATSAVMPAYLPANISQMLSMAIISSGMKQLGLKCPTQHALRYLMTSYINGEGFSINRVNTSNFLPVPLSGLDTRAMEVKAIQIKQEGTYGALTRNCAWATLECLKAGLPEEVVKQLASTGLWVTPTDVQTVIDFLVENGHVLLGETDSSGVSWFDAQAIPFETINQLYETEAVLEALSEQIKDLPDQHRDKEVLKSDFEQLLQKRHQLITALEVMEQSDEGR